MQDVPCLIADRLEVLILLFYKWSLHKKLRLPFGVMDFASSGKPFLRQDFQAY